jgi:hypothetical protein
LVLQLERGTAHIYASVGTFNLFKEVNPVDFGHLRASSAPGIVPESLLWLEVSAIGCDQLAPPYIHRLPILEDLVNNPWHFTTDDPAGAKLVFKIYSAIKGESRQNALVGTGIALLSNLREGLGPERESLVRDYQIPLLGLNGDYMGTITFNFIVSLPFKAAQGPLTPPQSMLPTCRTQVGGHRGRDAV